MGGGKSKSDGFAAALRSLTDRRIPFGGLLLAALAGILIARVIPIPLVASITAFGIFGAAAIRERWRIAIWPATAMAFVIFATLAGPLSPASRLAETLAGDWQVTSVEFRITTDPEPAGSEDTWRFRAELMSADTRIPIMVRWRGHRPAYGEVWQLDGSIRNLAGPRNPGQFDYRAYLHTFGIESEMRVNAPTQSRPLRIEANPIFEFAIFSRQWIEKTLDLDIAGTTEAAVIRAMTVGDTSGIPRATEDQFRQIGVFHLFSVSGLHVGLIALILWAALTMTPLGSRRAVWVLIPCVFFYALLTGWKPASVRAATMIALVAGGLVLDRRALGLNSVAAAAFLILLVNPRELFNPGFQLSFGVVFAILAAARPARQFLEGFGQPDPFVPRELLTRVRLALASTARYFAAITAVSIAAWIGSLPLTIWYFHLISLAAIPANLCAIPIAGAMLGLSLLALACGLISPWLAGIFNNTNLLITKGLLAAIQGVAAIPGSHFYVAAPDPPGTVATLTVLDCGAGGATTIQTHHRTWLVDAGSSFDSDSIVGPFLRSRGVNTISTAVLTHGDARHLGGFSALLDQFPIQRVLDSALSDRSPTRKALVDLLRDRDIPMVTVTAGETFDLAPTASVEILYPPADSPTQRADDKALVLRVTVGAFRALLLSDSGWPTETWLLQHAASQLDCDLLIRGMHFSGHGGGTDFLRATSPSAIIVTGADFPPHEQISAESIASATHLSIPIYRQNETGAVTIRVRSGTFEIIPFLLPNSTHRFELP